MAKQKLKFIEAMNSELPNTPPDYVVLLDDGNIKIETLSFCITELDHIAKVCKEYKKLFSIMSLGFQIRLWTFNQPISRFTR